MIVLASALLSAGVGFEHERGTRSIDLSTNYFFIGERVSKQIPVYTGFSNYGLSTRIKMGFLDITPSVNVGGDFRVNYVVFYQFKKFRFRIDSNASVSMVYRF